VAKLGGADLEHPSPAGPRQLGAAVARGGVDDQQLHRLVHVLAIDAVEAAPQVCASVLDRDDDGDHCR
jgi:hypothetical protein